MGAGRLEGTASFGSARASFSNQRSSAGTTTDRTRPVETFAGLGRDRPIVSPALARSSVRKRPRRARRVVSRSPAVSPSPPDISSSRSSEKRVPESGKTRSVARAARRTRCVDASADACAHTRTRARRRVRRAPARAFRIWRVARVARGADGGHAGGARSTSAPLGPAVPSAAARRSRRRTSRGAWTSRATPRTW